DAAALSRGLRRGDVVGGLLDRAATPQIVVQGAIDRCFIQPEQHVDARRLDVGIHDADRFPSLAIVAATLATRFDFPVPPRNECRETIVAISFPLRSMFVVPPRSS